MAENWTKEELKSAVDAYLDMHQKELDGQRFTKKSYYSDLSERFGRTEKSYEYRMQNISYVFSVMGRQWVTGLKPAKNVGARVAVEIEKLIHEAEDTESATDIEFQVEVQTLAQKPNLSEPDGSTTPKKTKASATQYIRDPKVAAWVLQQAKGKCECCGRDAPFIREDGTPYLEVHHLRRLADGGSDIVSNAVAACPNCHRELHYGQGKKQLVDDIVDRVDRLVGT